MPITDIVLLVYGTLYMIFTAFPIVFEEERHWSQGISGLSYIGVMVGQILSMFFYIFMEVKYQKKIAQNPAKARPEGRLDPALIGGVLLPIGLFWFAWSTYGICFSSQRHSPWLVRSCLVSHAFLFTTKSTTNRLPQELTPS